jgi:hypothetical protein
LFVVLLAGLVDTLKSERKTAKKGPLAIKAVPLIVMTVDVKCRVSFVFAQRTSNSNLLRIRVGLCHIRESRSDNCKV